MTAPLSTARPNDCGSLIGKRVAETHKASKWTCDAPRFPDELTDEGVSVGDKCLERLMNAKGLRCKFVATTRRDPRAQPSSDLVDRNLYANIPNAL